MISDADSISETDWLVLNPGQLERFGAKHTKGSVNECWIWTGATSGDGYGSFTVRGRTNGAHRYAYRMHKGPIPRGMNVCHSCDNPPCVNPDHLWLGTQTQNIHDMERKGRARHPRGDDSGLRKHPHRVARGEKADNAKLTNEKVRAIRAEYSAGIKDQPTLAREHGVTQVCISQVVLRKSWKHVI